MITTRADAAALVGRLQHRTYPVCSIDCETVGINPKEQPAAGPAGRIVCWSIAWEEETGIQSAVIWANSETWAVLGPVLLSLPVIGHNILGFDAHMFRKAGWPLCNIVADTLRDHRLINPSEDAEHGLKSIMRWWLGWEPVGSFEGLFSRRKFLGEEVLEEKSCKRKVGDEKGVPTVMGGRVSRLGAGTEPLPLDRIPTDHPELLPLLDEYAGLDARAPLAIYFKFTSKFVETAWDPPIRQHCLASGSSHPERPVWSNLGVCNSM